jgi:tetratricopeptide (TPR) repeat protein
MTCFRLAVAFVIVAGIGHQAEGEDSWQGRRVITKFGTVLRVGKRVVDDEKREPDARGSERRLSRVYRVERVNGPWLWVVEEGRAARGWVRVGQVVPFEDAIDYYTEGIRANPTASAYASRAAIWCHRKEYDLAIGDCNDAIRLDPRYEVAHSSRGLAWYAKGEYDRAIADYGEAIRLDPRYPAAFNNRGNAWRAKRDYDRALADYTEAIRLDPKDAFAFNNRGIVWSDRGEYDKAIADYSEAIRLDPRFAHAFNNRGLAWQDKGALDRAIADYSEAIRLDPKDARPLNDRGTAWSGKGEYDRAIVDFDAALRLDPADGLIHRNRADARKAKKEYGKALADYSEAIRLDPRDAWAYNRRAWIWATCPEATYRDGTRAVESATRACELTDWKDANLIDTLAAAHAEAGDFDRAVEHLRKANDLCSDAGRKRRGEQRLELYRDKKPYREEPAR